MFVALLSGFDRKVLLRVGDARQASGAYSGLFQGVFERIQTAVLEPILLFRDAATA